MKVRLLMLFTALLLVGGVAVVVSGRGDDQPTQSWKDFDAPPYTAGIEVGRTYEYSVGAHCGVKGARIDGTNWRPEVPIADGQDVPGWNNIGRLRIETPTRAVFENEKYQVVFLRDDLPPGPPCA
jgi:hypothetical protein